MRVVDRLAQREASWRELDLLLDKLNKRQLPHARASEVVRLGELYRAACTDLMLAESHDLPRETVAYLHALVGRAHNAVYRAEAFDARSDGDGPRRNDSIMAGFYIQHNTTIGLQCFAWGLFFGLGSLYGL